MSVLPARSQPLYGGEDPGWQYTQDYADHGQSEMTKIKQSKMTKIKQSFELVLDLISAQAHKCIHIVQDSYRQVLVKFKDFSRISQDYPTVFKD